VDFKKRDPSEIPDLLQTEGDALIREHLLYIIDYAKDNRDKADRSWPVLLKSNAFFTYITTYLAGVRRVQVAAGPTNGSSSSGKRKKRDTPEGLKKKLTKQVYPLQQ
jgi:hypothetical protein